MKKSILVLTLLGFVSLGAVADPHYENGKEIKKYENSMKKDFHTKESDIKKEYNQREHKIKNHKNEDKQNYRHHKKNYLKDLNLTPEQKEKYKIYKERKRQERIDELSLELNLTPEQVENLNKKMKY